MSDDPPVSAPLERRLRAAVPWVALLALVLWAPLVLRSDHSWDDADPEILNNCYRFAQGKSLYHSLDSPPWVVMPYTPLYPVLVGELLKLTGLSYLPGRLVSALASVALAGALALLARRWRGRAREGLWAMCLLTLVPAVLFNLARPHPQALAVALTVWSFALFESRVPVVANVASPLLAVLAIYTKQTQIVLPVAMALWLLWSDRRRLPYYAGALALLGLVPALWLNTATGGLFRYSVLDLNLLPYRAWQTVPVLIHQAGPFFAFGMLALWRLRDRLARRTLEAIDFYLLAVIATTVPSLGRVGASGQYVFEMVVVAAIFLLRTGGLVFPPRFGALATFQLAALLAYGPLFVLLEEGSDARASIAAAGAVRRLLETRPGPVISQQGSFSLFTRGEIHVQLFHMASLVRMGKWDQAPLIREIEERRIAWVVTESPLERPIENDDDWERFTPEVHDALARNYVRTARVGPYYVYSPG